MNVFFLLQPLYFLKHRRHDSTSFFSWGNFISVVRDNCAFPQLNFPFLLEVTATFLLVKVGQLGNSLISLNYVDMIFKWQIQTFPHSCQSPDLTVFPVCPSTQSKSQGWKRNLVASDLCKHLINFRLTCTKPSFPQTALYQSFVLYCCQEGRVDSKQ